MWGFRYSQVVILLLYTFRLTLGGKHGEKDVGRNHLENESATKPASNFI